MDWILHPLAEFPFVSEDDRATWIGLLFTPILRPLLEPPYQLGVITATNPASGKTLLAKMIRTTHGGVLRGEMPRDADELRKSITAALLDTTGPVIAFDNLTGVIRSSVLEALLTDRTWSDRCLGQNRRSLSPMTGCGWPPGTTRIRRRPGPPPRYRGPRSARGEPYLTDFKIETWMRRYCRSR